MPDAVPLRPTLLPCPTCGALVLVRLWHGARRDTPPRWEELDVPLTPVTGEEHVCPTP